MRECEQQSAGKIALLKDTGGGRKRDSGGDKWDGEEDKEKEKTGHLERRQHNTLMEEMPSDGKETEREGHFNYTIIS